MHQIEWPKGFERGVPKLNRLFGFLQRDRQSLRSAKKPRTLVGIFHGIIKAFNHLDLICHLDFDICHSNRGPMASEDMSLISEPIRGRWLIFIPVFYNLSNFSKSVDKTNKKYIIEF